MTKYSLITPAMLPQACLPVGGQPVARVETNFSYSYMRYWPDAPAQTFLANGGTFQLVYNFNKWIGVVGDFGGYRAGGISASGLDNTLANYMFGPRFSFRKKKTVNPYVQALFGGAWVRTNGDNPLAVPLGINTPAFHTTGSEFAMLAGAGVDIRVGRRIAFRPVEADYFLTKLPNPLFEAERMENNVRLSAGVSFLFGGEKPAPVHPAPRPPAPPAMTQCPDGSTVPAGTACPKMQLRLNVNIPRAQMCQGETMSLIPALSGNRGDVGLQWTVNGKPTGQEPKLQFGANGLAPGTYRIGLTATGAAYQPASSQATIQVLEQRAPTGNVQANPSEIFAGERSSLTATFQGQCFDPIGAPTYTASDGSVSGSEFDSSGVRFDPPSSPNRGAL